MREPHCRFTTCGPGAGEFSRSLPYAIDSDDCFLASSAQWMDRPEPIKFPASPTFGIGCSCHPEAVARAVLIVDDDDAFGDLAARVVTGWGHVVVGHRGSVAAALIQAEELRPDVVLVDIGLPDGDGFALTEQLIAMPWPMQVVLISSDSDPANLTAALRAGASGFVPKDELSSVELRDRIEQG